MNDNFERMSGNQEGKNQSVGRDKPARRNADVHNSAKAAARQDVKTRVHQKLVDMLDLASLARVEPEELKAQLRPAILELVDEESVLLSATDRQEIVVQILNEIFGFGPLEPLLADDTVSDILVNGSQEVYVERFGKLEPTSITFRDDDHLMQVIERIVSRVGRRIDETSPMVDARLPDGSRVNAIIPPLAIDGPALAIRRFGVNPLGVPELLKNHSITEEIVAFLKAAVRGRLNILISGGTGSGKTTLLNALSSFIPGDERIITIEDSAELMLQQPHVVRLETRPPNIEGAGQITQRELLFNSLRMRPDRIVVGEVRGAEALDMLQAMNTGHEGSLTTIHANSPRDALSRIETMVSMAGFDLPVSVVRQQMSSALNLVVQAARLHDGKRRILSVMEVLGMEGQIITMQEIFTFQLQGCDEETGMLRGEFISTGIRPRCVDKIRANGIPIDDCLFQRHVHSFADESPRLVTSEKLSSATQAVSKDSSPSTSDPGRKASRRLGGLTSLRERLRAAS